MITDECAHVHVHTVLLLVLLQEYTCTNLSSSNLSVHTYRPAMKSKVECLSTTTRLFTFWKKGKGKKKKTWSSDGLNNHCIGVSTILEAEE